MKKILWFSNCIQSSGSNKASGSWLFSMARLLLSTGKIHLVNITKRRSGASKDVKHNIIGDHFEEYILPNWETVKNGWPSDENCNKIKNLCATVAPDIVHVWGVENYFCTLVPTFNLPVPTLLEIQGLHAPCADVYYGDLSIRETLACFGLREILFPHKKSIYKDKSKMRRSGKTDEKAIKLYSHISIQSRWIRDRISLINNDAHIYETGMSIREEFWKADKWEYEGKDKDFYCSAAGPAPYKSIQTAIRSLKIVTKKYADTKLYIIGNFKDEKWLHQPGYLTFLKKLIKNLGLEKNVIFTGPLNALEIVETMHKCIGMIQTSYVESYSLAVAEAQAVGVPSIISYAGAMPELAENYKSGLFFSPGDSISCASKMIALIEDKTLAENISEGAYELAHNRNNNDFVVSRQMEIYETMTSYAQ